MSDSKNGSITLQERFQSVNQEAGLKSYLDMLLSFVSDAVIFVNLQGKVLIFNEAAKQLFGLNGTPVFSQSFWETFPDDYFGFSMREALKFGIAHRFIYKTYPSLDKEIEIKTFFFREGGLANHGIFLILKDITERQKKFSADERNDRLRELGEMTATVAHEIRNPLGGIRGYASLLVRDLEKAPHLQEMASTIVEGTKSLEKMVSAILLYAKPIEIELQMVEVGSLLRGIGKFIKADASFPYNVKLEMHIPDEPLWAPLDTAVFRGALLNLLFNALQAMPYGGVLTISLLKMQTHYLIAITDTGLGMGQELLQHLFSPFFTTKKQGNGLGLVETKKIVKAHFGSIDVRSQENKGTTFTLTLPLKRVL